MKPGGCFYHWLEFELNFRTKSNHHLSLGNIYVLLQNTFYYGVFEYPQKSGNWYNGYAKYLLKEGSITEKREPLTNLKSWLTLKNKQLVIEQERDHL